MKLGPGGKHYIDPPIYQISITLNADWLVCPVDHSAYQ